MGSRIGRLRPGHRIRRRFERPDNAVDPDRGGEGGTFETNLFPESVATQKEKPSKAKPSGTIRPPSALPIISGNPHPTGRSFVVRFVITVSYWADSMKRFPSRWPSAPGGSLLAKPPPPPPPPPAP